MSSRIVRYAVLAIGLAWPGTSAAQAVITGTISGVVRDTSDSVMPGVTVEASSPALIEKVRTAVTDEQGRYSIPELRGGVYVVTFALGGFATVSREGIELTTGFTATVNAVLRVGAVEETITVSGASPVVDTQNVRTQRVMTRETIDAIPTNNAVQGFAALIPGAMISGSNGTPDVGGTQNDSSITFAVGGRIGQDLKQFLDGMPVATSIGTGGGTARHYTFNPAAAQELVIQTVGLSAEAETGGAQVNMVPRDGGDTFRGTFETYFANGSMQSDNLDDDLKSRGAIGTAKVDYVANVRGGIGGPLMKERLWFFTSHGWWSSKVFVPGNFYNATPDTLFYTPDLSHPAYLRKPNREDGVRVTWTPIQKHKIAASFSDEHVCSCNNGVDTGISRPEAAVDWHYKPVRVTQVSWNYVASSKWLFEAGYTNLVDKNDNRQPDRTPGAQTRVMQDLSDNYYYGSRFSGFNAGDYSIPPGFDNGTNSTRFALSHVTGSNTLKVGGSTLTGRQILNIAIPSDEIYVFRSRVPVSLTQITTPHHSQANLDMNMGLYVQDQIHLTNLTLNLGLRYSYLNTSTPAQDRPAGTYAPTIHFDEVDNILNWKDISPRIGASYDLFGNGKTAIKGTFGHYVQGESTGITAQIAGTSRLVTQATRTWNDTFYGPGDPRSGNYVPDCDLHNYDLNGECGALSDKNLGKLSATAPTIWSDDVTHGWARRPGLWETSATLQHELRPGIGLGVSYNRTWQTNFRVTDNLTLTPQDYDPFCLTVPVDARIPGGGGNQLCGAYDLKPDKFGIPAQNVVKPASDFGKQSAVYNGVDVIVDARLGRRGRLGGGLSTGQTVNDGCLLVDSPQALMFCHQVIPWSAGTQIKLNGVYPLPWQLEAAATWQMVPGPANIASYVATNAEIRASLGRNLAQCGSSAVCNGTATITNLFDPNVQFEERRQQVDLRVSRTLKLGAVRVRGNLDLYNLFNANSVVALTTRYSPTNSWLRPTSILSGRMLRVGAQLDF